MSTETLERVDLDPVTGEPRAAHLIKRDPRDPRTAVAIVMEARFNGTEVEALCGYRWIPQRDPRAYPVCSKCKEIYDAEKRADDPTDYSIS